MSKITYTPVLKKKNSKDTIGLINVRVTEDRKSIYQSTRISLHQRFWNNKGKDIESKLRDQKGFDKDERLSIIESVNKLTSKLKKEHSVTGDISTMKLNEKVSFTYHLDEYVKFLEQRKKIGTSKRYKTTHFHIKKYLKKANKTDLNFTDLTSSFIESFESYLINEGNKINTTKNYINCIKRIYTRCTGKGIYHSPHDPFVDFVNRRVEVKKDYLQKKEIEKIITVDIQNDNPLKDIRNYFLFQVFGQGLRISDLLTLKFSKVIEGNITFHQYKTKKEHTIYLTPTSMWILKDYVKSDKIEKVISTKYKYSIKEIKYSLPITEIKNQYKDLQRKYLDTPIADKKNRELIFKDIEALKSILDKVNELIFNNLVIILHEYSKKHRDSFIFPILKPEIYEGVIFDENTTLTKQQYNHLQSKTTIYNRKLKDLQKLCQIELNLTSHIPRHTYTNLMLQIGGDVYEISRSLGHQGLKTTEKYVSLIKDKIVNRNKDLGRQF